MSDFIFQLIAQVIRPITLTLFILLIIITIGLVLTDDLVVKKNKKK